MEHVFIDMREQGLVLSKHFKNKDLVSVEDILAELEDTLDKLDYLQEEFDDYKEYVKDNYREIPYSEQVGYNERNFFEER